MAEQEIKIYVAEKLAKAKKRIKICNHCGTQTHELMTSAKGSVCPDCYDSCSD